MAAINNGAGVNGVGVLSGDSCAGCHRIHRAQGEPLLKDADTIGVCTACHGASGVGATVDVENGNQYAYQLSPATRGGATLLGYTPRRRLRHGPHRVRRGRTAWRT